MNIQFAKQYPKLLLFLCTILIAYSLYSIGAFDWMDSFAMRFGFLSFFVAGMLFTTGFTTAFGIASLIALADTLHPLAAAPIAALGACVADLTIFRVVQASSFHDEINRLKSTRFLLWLRSLVFHDSVSEKIRSYLMLAFAGLVIASPLPDEVGVTLIGGMGTISRKEFAVICFVGNAIGILFILLAARAAGI